MMTEYFTVRVADWEWRSDYGRFEYVFTYPAIDQYIYERGSVQAGVYIEETVYENGRPKKYEVLKPLPFEREYFEDDVYYSERLSYDISVGSIGFFVESTALDITESYLRDYTYKVTLFWER